MSNGFPNRPGRSTFGAPLVNAKPVRNPTLNPDADIFNLAFFQIAGMGLMVPRAWVYFDGTPTARIIARAESWNPDAKTAAPYTPPVLARTSTGLYTLTYLSTYPDDSGSQVSLSPVAPVGLQVGSANVRNVAVTASGPVLTINLKEFQAGNFVAVDGQVLVWFM
jgi:hypothetical protein